jgi:uncharacterized membrane protein
MDLQPIQTIVGAVLFLASGYCVTLAAFSKDEIDSIERLVLSLFFSIAIPAFSLMVANLVLGIKLDVVSVYAIYIIVIAASLAYKYKFRHEKHKAAA